MRYSLGLIVGTVIIAFGFGYGFSVWRSGHLTARFNALEKENAALRQKLLISENRPEDFDGAGFRGLEAKTFSAYAFNNRGLMAASAGSVNGVTVGMPAVVGGDVLIGRITEVHRYYSVVQTLRDPAWSLAVRLGDDGAEGLLSGGPEPQVTLIGKEFRLAIGDSVFAASPEVPLGLKVGQIRKLSDDPAEAFLSAQVLLAAPGRQLPAVQIITNFP